MKNILISFMFLLPLYGCAGMGLYVGTVGTVEKVSDPLVIEEGKNNIGYKMPETQYTKEETISLWGEPDEVTTVGACEVLTYYDGYSWSGVFAVAIIIPVPLLIPSGYDENRIYFRDGKSIKLVSEVGEVIHVLGLVWASDGGFVARRVYQNRKVEVNWCNQSP
jgi:hypothetical protein